MSDNEDEKLLALSRRTLAATQASLAATEAAVKAGEANHRSSLALATALRAVVSSKERAIRATKLEAAYRAQLAVEAEGRVALLQRAIASPTIGEA